MPDYLAPNAAPFLLERGAHAVLLIHGFTGSAGHMRPLGDALHQAGFTVQGILLPGHGTRPEDMETEGGADPWKEATFSAYHALLEKYDSVAVMGLSLGGVLSLLTASLNPAPACIVTFSAPMLLQNPLSPLAPLLGLFTDILQDPIPRDRGENFLNEYDAGYSATPVHRVTDLRRLIHEARETLPEITCPALVMQSHVDPTVRPKSAQIIYDGIMSSEKELLWLDKPGHVITLGPDRDTVFQRATDWAMRFSGQQGTV